MSALTNQDWNFDQLLKEATEREVRIVRLYEYAREVTIWTDNTISLGQAAMLMAHPHLVTPLCSFCITKPGCSNRWLRVPYFKLSRSTRADLLKLYDVHLAALIDPSHPSHGMPFVPVGPIGPVSTSSERIELELPIQVLNQFRRECFDALLAQRFPESTHPASEGGKAEIRLLKNDLRHLGALRLVRHMSAISAIRYSARKSGQALYATASGWSRAKREAAKIIQSFESELRPIKELFASAPRDITSFSYNSATGRLEH